MFISVSRVGVSVSYKCYYPKPHPFWKCKKKIPSECFRCRYCEARMSAKEATELLDKIEKLQIKDRYKKENERDNL